ncbi:MAG: S8 family serine peptidase [Acidobacteriota bacterium]
MKQKTKTCAWLLLAAALPMAAAAASGAPLDWTFLSTTTIGAKDFVKAHPDWDGRGVLIAVCDSGVDLGLPGLTVTSDGKPKILDARIFLENRKVSLERAEAGQDANGKALRAKDGKWLYGFESLGLKPPSEKDLYVAYFKEEDLKNSDARDGDLNGNGSKDDVYGMVAFPESKAADAPWLAVVDTNADGSLADEKPVRDFAVAREAFELRGRDVHAQAKVMGFALNLWPSEKKAALYMADGSHGTHVAGICAGFGIDGQPGFDGVAPGAQVLALKIGDNTLSGGATTPGSMVAAWRYAVKKAKELGMPLVIQMSYGVGSENEGTAEAERLLDELLEENPDVVATVSAGNEGPGLSTVGLPACMANALSVAAVLNRDSAKDLYGASLAQDEMFSFSSRGAEAAKPDVACPGFSASTVPNYEDGRSVFRGTSMAAPQAAGALALLLSAARAEGLDVRRDHAAMALKRGARPMAGYGPLDYGWGLVDVPRAYSILQSLARRGKDAVLTYRAETESPEMAGLKGPAVHWRGAYYPRDGKTQTVTVKAVFPRALSADGQARFFQAFDLESTAPWLRLEKGSIFLKAEQGAVIPFTFDAAAIRKPGLYQARILGYLKGAGRELGPDWAVPVSVVVPEDLSAGAFFSRNVDGIQPARVERLFLRVPPEAGGARLDLEAPAGQQAIVACYLHDPEGRQREMAVLRPDRRKGSFTLDGEVLAPGVWEVDLYANYLNKAPAAVRVEARALPLGRPAAGALSAKLSQGQTPRAELEILSGLPDALKGTGSGEILGSFTEKTVRPGGDPWKKTFSVAPGEARVTFRLTLSAEDFGKFTDIPVQILDADGNALVSEGMGYRHLEVDFSPPSGAKPDAKYTLKVWAATADPEDEDPSWKLRVQEIHHYAAPVALSVKQGKSPAVALYPDHPAKVSLEAASVPPALPEGGSWLARVVLRDAEREGLALSLELKLGAGE